MSLGWGCTQPLSVQAGATAEHLGTQTPSIGTQQGTQTFQPRSRVLVNHPRTDGGGANEAPPQLKSYQQVKAAGMGEVNYPPGCGVHIKAALLIQWVIKTKSREH